MLDFVGNFAFFDEVDALNRFVVLSVEDGALRLVTLFEQVEELL